MVPATAFLLCLGIIAELVTAGVEIDLNRFLEVKCLEVKILIAKLMFSGKMVTLM